jgi:hypothetical protein
VTEDSRVDAIQDKVNDLIALKLPSSCLAHGYVQNFPIVSDSRIFSILYSNLVYYKVVLYRGKLESIEMNEDLAQGGPHFIGHHHCSVGFLLMPLHVHYLFVDGRMHVRASTRALPAFNILYASRDLEYCTPF